MAHDDRPPDQQTQEDDLEHVSLLHLLYFHRAAREAFASVDLTFHQGLFLIFVGRGHETPAELAKIFELPHPRVSALSSRMVEARLVNRREDAKDRRRITLELTSAGLETCQKLQAAWREKFPLNLSKFSDEELKDLSTAARLVTERAFS